MKPHPYIEKSPDRPIEPFIYSANSVYIGKLVSYISKTVFTEVK